MNNLSENIKYSIVIPVYNSTRSLPELVLRINRVFENLPNTEHEIIFVDDASVNMNTWPTLSNLQKEYINIRIVQFTRNYGQQSATLCGIEKANGDFFITMDDDLQHQPEDIPKLISMQYHDVVIAQFARKNHSLLTKLTSRLKGWFDYKLIGKPKNISMSPFRLLNRTVRDAILQIKTPYPFLPALLFSVTQDVVGVKAGHTKEFEGKSNYNFWKRLKLFSNLLINNSSFLLQLIASIGIIISILSFLTAVYLIIKKIFFGIPVVGWTSIIATVLFIGGIMLFSIGILGEYLVRIIDSVENKPTYSIRRTQGFDQ